MSDEPTIQPPPRLYVIQNDVYHYVTGRLSNGNQVLMMGDGSDSGIPSFPRVEFDTQGDVVAVHRQEPVEKSVVSDLFTPGAIHVKSFFIPDIWFGIQDLPDHYQKLLDHPESVNKEERLDWMKDIDSWRNSNEFVLWCNEDFYLSEDGDLESS